VTSRRSASRSCFAACSRPPVRRLGAALWAAVTLAVVGVPSALPAQEAKTARPLLTFTIAGIDRLLEDADYMFASIDRSELSETLAGLLANARDLKGMDRTKPLGVMLFLDGFNPQVVGFVPVTNLDEMMQTLSFGPVAPQKKGDGEYEIAGGAGTLTIRQIGGYAFGSNNAANLDQDFADPDKLLQRFNNAYDISLSLNIKSIPRGTKGLFLDFLRAQQETELQQRDNEPDAAYAVRKAAAEGQMQGFEQFVNETEEVTIGWNVSSKEKSAYLEFVIAAEPKSEYAALLNELKSTRSIFADLVDENAPLSISVSSLIDPPGKKMLLEMIKAGNPEVSKRFGEATGLKEGDVNPIDSMFSALGATIEKGKIDVAAQVLGEPPGPFVFLGGIKVADDAGWSSAAVGILDRLKGNEAFETVETNVSTHEGITFHRIKPRGLGRGGERIYGTNPHFYVGAGKEVLWIAFGAEDALPKLKKAVDTVGEAGDLGKTVPPMRLVFHAGHWLSLFGDANDRFTSLARQAFSKGGDAIRVDISHIDDGMRSRLTFEEGWVRLVGMGIASQIDRGLGN